MTGPIVAELATCGHGSQEMPALYDALVQVIILKRIWRDKGQVSSHIYVFIAEFAHVPIHIVQELVCIVVGRSGSGDGGKT